VGSLEISPDHGTQLKWGRGLARIRRAGGSDALRACHGRPTAHNCEGYRLRVAWRRPSAVTSQPVTPRAVARAAPGREVRQPQERSANRGAFPAASTLSGRPTRRMRMDGWVGRREGRRRAPPQGTRQVPRLAGGVPLPAQPRMSTSGQRSLCAVPYREPGRAECAEVAPPRSAKGPLRSSSASIAEQKQRFHPPTGVGPTPVRPRSAAGSHGGAQCWRGQCSPLIKEPPTKHH